MGVGMAFARHPTSEPDVRISRIRLSGHRAALVHSELINKQLCMYFAP